MSVVSRLITVGFVLGWCVRLAAAPRFDQPLVPDVHAAFQRIEEGGRPLGAWGGSHLPYPSYSLNRDHDVGDNHFQGVQRLRAGPYLVVSGSNIGRDGDRHRQGLLPRAAWNDLPPAQGDLIVMRLGHRPTPGPLGPNTDAAQRPHATASVVARVPIRLPLDSGTVLWHPGGLSACGDILVVPVENYNAKHGEVCSQILFYDFSEPEKPRRLPLLIDRTKDPVKDKSGAAAMIRLADGRFLLASRTTTVVSFYLTRTANLLEGFEPTPTATLDEKKVGVAPGLTFAKFGGSSINFIRQRDGRLFLMGYSRVKAEPEKQVDERQIASLWEVHFPGGDFRTIPELTRVAERAFRGKFLGEDA